MCVDMLTNILRGVSSAHVYVLIVIITTITIINCQEIDGSTVRTSLTDTEFFVQHSHTSTAVPNDPSILFNSGSTDACNINQTLVISDTPVRLKAFTGQQLCSVLMTTNGRFGLFVSILHSGLKSAYSYVFTEVLGNESTPCSGQYLHVSDEPIPCSTIIKGSHFRFSFQYTEIIFEVRVDDFESRDCFRGLSELFDNIDNIYPSCNLARYQRQVGQKEDQVNYLPWISFNVTRYFVNRECKCTDPLGGCVLDRREWHYSCNDHDDETMNKAEVDWISYRYNVDGISFANTSLGTITPHAFDGLNSLKYLILNHNNIRTLSLHMFRHLSRLQVLDLSYNYISNLTYFTFDPLNGLCYLDLSYNGILRPPVAVIDMFIIDGQMESYLFDLSHNNIVLPDGMFTELKNIIGKFSLSHNDLVILPEGIFTSLEMIQGSLDLSHNDFSSLPDGSFSSLEQIWSPYKERGAIDLSHNQLVMFPDGIFISLWLLDGSINLMCNNLTTLPDGIFSNLVVIMDGNLILSHNHLSILPTDIFASLKVVKDGIIDLSHNDLVMLPDFISLQRIIIGLLNFSYNKLNALPHDFLASLLILDGTIDLDGKARLVPLPHGIFSSLEEMNTKFNFSHRNLYIIPQGMFASLRIIKGTLDLSHNLLSSLPEGIFVLLREMDGTLDLSHNNFTTLPERFLPSILKMRGKVDLSRNRLTNLEYGTFHSLGQILKTYGALDLSYNQMSPRHLSIRTITGRFHISHNGMRVLHDEMFVSVQVILGVLDLSHNNLILLPNGMFASLKQINGTLDLSYNNLIRLSYKLFADVQILGITLELSYNNWATFPNKTVTSVEYLWGSVKEENYTTLASLEHLTSLLVFVGIFDLSSSKSDKSDRVTLPDGIFNPLEEILGTVNLSYNKIVALLNGIFAALWNLDGSLDISFNDLVSLPDGIFESLIELRGTINLSFNKLVKLPEGIFSSLKSILGKLDLSSNQLTALPNRIFTSVLYLGRKTLDLEDIKSNSLIQNRNFSSFKYIYKYPGLLNLSRNELTTLSADIFSTIADMQGTLGLSQNKLTTVPHVILSLVSRFQNVTVYLEGNRFHHFPYVQVTTPITLIRGKLHVTKNAITPMKLTYWVFNSLAIDNGYLDFSFNGLITLPDDIFTSLRMVLGVLDLRSNHLRTLPQTSFKNVSLDWRSSLILSNNELISLPHSMFKSGVINNVPSKIDISSNRLSILPDDLFASQMALASNLKFDNNSLIKLPDKIFTKLLYFGGAMNFSHNHLTFLPDGMFRLVVGFLGELNLQYNSLIRLPNELFPYFINTGMFDFKVGMSEEMLKSPFAEMGMATLLSQIMPTATKDYIHGSKTNWLMFGTMVDSVVNINLKHNNLTELPDNIFTSIDLLNRLYLGHNYLSTLPERVFNSTRHLQILDLSYNKLKTLPSDVFRPLKKLVILDLGHNDLTRLPANIFGALDNLVSLKCNDNRLVIKSPLFNFLSSLNILDISNNVIQQLPHDIFYRIANLLTINLSGNSLESIPTKAFANISQLIALNVSRNALSNLPMLKTLVELRVLDLNENKLQILTSKIFRGLTNLESLHLSNNRILEVPSNVFIYLISLQFVNLSGNGIQHIGYEAFGYNITNIDLRKNGIYRVTDQSFKSLNDSAVLILVDRYSTCCFIKHAKCLSQEARPDYLTCKRMLPYYFVRIPIWLIGLFSVLCNVGAFFIRSRKKESNKIQTLLISHLSISDLLMGISLLILAVSDIYYGEFFPLHAHMWTEGPLCKVAGFLSIISNEGSVFLITLISIDRCLVIKHPFRGYRFTTTTARVSVSLIWLITAMIGAISIGLAGEKSDVFRTSEVCIGIPIIRPQETIIKYDSILLKETNSVSDIIWSDHKHLDSGNASMKALVNITTDIKTNYVNISYSTKEITGSTHSPILSIFIFIVVNFVCFIIVACCYVEIFRVATSSSQKVSSTHSGKSELRMARKMFLIVFTDFCCWVPLCFVCILAQCQVITISPELYAWIIGFILPINSTMNPILYVMKDEISDYFKKKKNANIQNK